MVWDLYINPNWIKEGVPYLWKKSIIIPIYKEGDKSDYNSNRVISLLSTP
jgi:hypothetical protein